MSIKVKYYKEVHNMSNYNMSNFPRLWRFKDNKCDYYDHYWKCWKPGADNKNSIQRSLSMGYIKEISKEELFLILL